MTRTPAEALRDTIEAEFDLPMEMSVGVAPGRAMVPLVEVTVSGVVIGNLLVDELEIIATVMDGDPPVGRVFGYVEDALRWLAHAGGVLW
jgi:hypothetical protein